MVGSSITLSLADWPGYRDFKVLDMWVLLFVLGGLVVWFGGLWICGLAGLLMFASGG